MANIRIVVHDVPEMQMLYGINMMANFQDATKLGVMMDEHELEKAINELIESGAKKIYVHKIVDDEFNKAADQGKYKEPGNLEYCTLILSDEPLDKGKQIEVLELWKEVNYESWNERNVNAIGHRKKAL